MMSKTISITIPDQLESFIQKEADKIGLSRSRFICNILLDWQNKNYSVSNDCSNLVDGQCVEFEIQCKAPQHEAETCAGYKKK